MLKNYIYKGILFLRSIPASELKMFAVIFIIFALYILVAAASGKGSLFSAAPVALAAKRALSLPKLHLSQPLESVLLASAALLQRIYFIFSGLLLLLSLLTLLGLVDGLFFYLAILIIAIIVTILWAMYYKQFSPYIKEINNQVRQYKSQ